MLLQQPPTKCRALGCTKDLDPSQRNPNRCSMEASHPNSVGPSYLIHKLGLIIGLASRARNK
jgi:hypothetical protein